jgi:molybdopterin-guanine dinucleotide biosynthesis protein A
MGRDKLHLKVGEMTLLERVTGTLADTCNEVLLVGTPLSDPPPGTRPVPDLRPGRAGPLAGIEAGLAAASHPSVFVAAADMPFLTRRVVEGLVGYLATGARIAVPRYDGRSHPLCAAYDRSALYGLSLQLDEGERSVWRALGHCEGVVYVEGEELRRLGEPARFLMNVNSPEDLEQARKTASERENG